MRLIPNVRWNLVGGGVVCMMLGAAIGGCTATAYQGHMENALNDLGAALNELQQATPNKGGHRENAIALVNQAMNEVQAGIAYAQQQQQP